MPMWSQPPEPQANLDRPNHPPLADVSSRIARFCLSKVKSDLLVQDTAPLTRSFPSVCKAHQEPSGANVHFTTAVATRVNDVAAPERDCTVNANPSAPRLKDCTSVAMR